MNKWLKLFFPMGMIRSIDGDKGGGGNSPAAFDPKTLDGDTWAGIQNMDSFKENTALRNTKNFEDMVNQFTNVQKLVGQDRLPMPKDDWTPEQWAAHFDRLGRPASPDKYGMPDEFTPEALKAQGVELNEEYLGDARKAMHEAGLTDKQAKTVLKTYFDWLGKATGESKQREADAFTTAETALKKEFGQDYDRKVQMGNALLHEMGDADTVAFIRNSGLGNNPGFVKMMTKIAESFGDDTAVGDSLSQHLSPANMAKKEIATLKADDQFRSRLFDDSNPGHKEAVARWQDLHKKAFPTK